MAEKTEDYLQIAENGTHQDDLFGVKSVRVAARTVDEKISEAKKETKVLKERMKALQAEKDEIEKMKRCRLTVSKLITMMTQKFFQMKGLDYVSFDGDDILKFASEHLNVQIPPDDVFIYCNFEKPIVPEDLHEDFFKDWVDSETFDGEQGFAKSENQIHDTEEAGTEDSVAADDSISAKQRVAIEDDGEHESKYDENLAKQKNALLLIQGEEKRLKAEIRAIEKEKKRSDKNNKVVAKRVASQAPLKRTKEPSSNKRTKKE